MAVGGEVPRLDFELATGCDHRCGHCYNVWNADEGEPQAGYPRRAPPSTPDLMALMSEAVRVSGAEHLTITGGEPLLRKDALKVLEHACSLVPSLSLITNGSHVTDEAAQHMGRMGVRSVQLTLLAGNREQHDRLKGAVCFDDTVRAAVRLKDAGVPVQCCYVAMSENAGQLRPVMELCVALGIRSLSYNRMSPTGGAIHHIERLLPHADQIEADLDTAERCGRAWGIQVATAMPVLPCMVRLDRYSWVRFGFCSTGSSSPNLVVDQWGDVRSCNLSSNILGNVLRDAWPSISKNPYITGFRNQLPDICRGCAYQDSCQGGCKESAFATTGELTSPEPMLWSVTRAS